MCGIVGFVGTGDREDIDRMVLSLKHRGPDGHGVFMHENVALGHTRLSIIDLSTKSSQPMISQDGNTVITFNGEIYNFKELRTELEKLGKKFQSTGDTEVVLIGYQVWGEGVFAKLHGMFALGIYDLQQHTLLLARDRLGKKPLYWSLMGSTFIFGSEMKALFEHRSFKKELNIDALDNYLAYEYTLTPETILSKTNKLEPGSYLSYRDGDIIRKKYWKLDPAIQDISFTEAVHQLDRHLEESVQKRLVADVPVGIFLSGGIDSSTIAYYAQKARMDKIKTFSIGFQEESFDESDHARLVAQHLGTDHHHEQLTAQQTLELIPSIADIIDEPVADASIIPTFLLSKLARKNVTVALGGDGADELLAGYPTFTAHQIANWYSMVPQVIRKFGIEPLLKTITSSFPASEKNFTFDYNIRKFLEGFSENPIERQYNWLGSFNSGMRSLLLNDPIKKNLSRETGASKLQQFADTWGVKTNRISYLYLNTYLLDDILVKVDRASMKTSLEVRSPFLDHRLVEFLFSLPYDFKYRHFKGKYILKNVMAGKLPDSIIRRPKKGFGIPLARWLKHELRPLCEELLANSVITNDGIFNPTIVSQLQKDHYSGRIDRRKELWTLMIFQMWKQRWLT